MADQKLASRIFSEEELGESVFLEDTDPATLPPKADVPVQEERVQETEVVEERGPYKTVFPPMWTESDFGESVYLDEEEYQPTADPLVFGTLVTPNIYKGMLDSLTFIPDVATDLLAKGLYAGAGYVAEKVFDRELDTEVRPYKLGDATKYLFELPQKLPDINLTSRLTGGIGGGPSVTIPKETWQGFSAHPREPRTDREKQIAATAYMGGMGLTFPIPLGVWKHFASQVGLQSPAGITARQILTQRYTAPEAFKDLMLKYGHDYVFNPSLRRVSSEGFFSALMGYGYSLPEGWDDPNEQILTNLPGIEGKVDVKPTLQLLFSMGFPIGVMTLTPARWLEGLGENGANLLAHLYKKGVTTARQMTEGFNPQGQKDLSSRIIDELTEPETKRLLLEALEEGHFFGTGAQYDDFAIGARGYPAESTPVTIAPNGEVIPATSALNPDTLQWLRDRGQTDLQLLALERQLGEGTGRIQRQRLVESERRRDVFNDLFEQFKLRLRGGDEQQVYDFLSNARELLRQNADELLENAKLRAAKAIEDLTPTRGPEEASLVARGILQKAHDDALREGRRLWSPEVLGTSTINARNIGDWALKQIENAGKVKREELPALFYRLAGTNRLNTIGIGEKGRPLNSSDDTIGAVLDGERPVVPESIPVNGLLDEVVPSPGATVPISAKPTTITEVDDMRGRAGREQAALNNSPTGNKDAARRLGEIKKFIDDDVLTIENIFQSPGGYLPRSIELISKEKELAEVTSLLAQRQRLLSDGGLAPEPAASVRAEIDQLTAIRTKFESELGELRATEQQELRAAQEAGVSKGVPLPQQIQAYKEARAYTQWVYDTFERSEGVGGILGYNYRGYIVDPSKTLKTLLTPGEGSGSAVRAFRDAINVPVKTISDDGVLWNSPPTWSKTDHPNIIESSLLHRLALKDRKVTETGVKNFIRQWEDTIKEIPGLKGRLLELRDAQAAVDDITARLTNPDPKLVKDAQARGGNWEDVEVAQRVRMRLLEDKRTEGSAFEYLDADPKFAAKRYMDSKPHQAEARAEELHRQLGRDTEGRAKAGFRSALWNTLKEMSSGTVYPRNAPEVLPEKLAENINTYRPYLERFFDDTQMAMLYEMVKGAKYARTGVDDPFMATLGEDIITTGRSEVVVEIVGAGGRVAGQHIGQDLIALNTLSASYLGKRLATRVWSKVGRAEIERILEEAMRNPEVAALLLRRADNLDPILPPLLDRAVGKVYNGALRKANTAREAHKIRKQEVRDAYNRAYQEAIDDGIPEAEAKKLAGEASSEASIEANRVLNESLQRTRKELQDQGVNVAQKGLGATLRFLAPYMTKNIERAMVLGLVPMTDRVITSTHLEEDWRLGAPYTFEDNRRRAEIEQQARNQAAAQTSLVAPQSIPNAASSLAQQPVVSPVGGQRPRYPGSRPAPVSPEGSMEQRDIKGQDLFPHDPIFGTAGFKEGGIASIQKNPRQMVY